MARSKKPESTVEIDGDEELKSLILRLPPHEHRWIKQVAEATNQTQPKVINYILNQVTKSPPTDYIEEIGKIHKAQQRKELLQKEAEIKEQLQKLDEELS